eukprot:2570968-Prymnesium_polylepis.2
MPRKPASPSTAACTYHSDRPEPRSSGPDCRQHPCTRRMMPTLLDTAPYRCAEAGATPKSPFYPCTGLQRAAAHCTLRPRSACTCTAPQSAAGTSGSSSSRWPPHAAPSPRERVPAAATTCRPANQRRAPCRARTAKSARLP